MRKDILNIIQKEFHRFFRDKRLVLTTIFLPAILIYALYSVLGAGANSMASVDEGYVPVCYVENMPDSFSPVFDSLGFQVTPVSDSDAALLAVQEKNADLLVVFPENFDAAIAEPGAGVPNVQVYHNSMVTESATAYDLFQAAATEYESALANVMDVQASDLATDVEKSSFMIASLLPMLIIMFLFSGCMSTAPESIAGEKERGTIATLLVTPVSRTAIAAGKIISLSFFALLSGLSSFVGVMLSLPKMLGPASDSFSINIYGISEYLCLLAVIATTVLLIVSIISVISAYANSVKEATTLATPLMLLASFSSLLNMFPMDFSAAGWRFVPIFNCVLCLVDVFSFDYSATNILITCAANLVYMLGMVFVLSKMFNSEKVMFKK